MSGWNKLLKGAFENLDQGEFVIFAKINQPRKVQYCMSIIHKVINEKRGDATWLGKFIEIGGMHVMTKCF
jgi:hypothetical protein